MRVSIISVVHTEGAPTVVAVLSHRLLYSLPEVLVAFVSLLLSIRRACYNLSEVDSVTRLVHDSCFAMDFLD